MKITAIILALAAAGILGHAMADDRTFALAITYDGHGGQHMQYYETNTMPDTSVALMTNSGGGVNGSLGTQRPLPDNGSTRFVVGNNQHAQAAGAYIPVSSNFSPGSQ